MVDSIQNAGPANTLLRAQSAGSVTGQQATQLLLNQKSNGVRPSAVQPVAKISNTSHADVLPRGSIVDILA